MNLNPIIGTVFFVALMLYIFNLGNKLKPEAKEVTNLVVLVALVVWLVFTWFVK